VIIGPAADDGEWTIPIEGLHPWQYRHHGCGDLCANASSGAQPRPQHRQ